MTTAHWTDVAIADLAGVDDWYAVLDADYADRVGRAAVAAGRFLAEFPAAGPVVDGDIRKWRVPSTDYILLYKIVDDGVEVNRVENARRDWRKSDT